MKASNFYGLTKIHKSEEIQNVIYKKNKVVKYIKLLQPKYFRIRLIIAGQACSPYRPSNLVGVILKPLCSHRTSFVQYDLDFLTHLPKATQFDALGW